MQIVILKKDLKQAIQDYISKQLTTEVEVDDFDPPLPDNMINVSFRLIDSKTPVPEAPMTVEEILDDPRR